MNRKEILRKKKWRMDYEEKEKEIKCFLCILVIFF